MHLQRLQQQVPKETINNNSTLKYTTPNLSFVHSEIQFSHASLLCVSLLCVCTRWRRHTGCLIFVGHFPQKSPMISGSFAENDQRLKAFYDATPPCTSTDATIVYFRSIFLHCRSHLQRFGALFIRHRSLLKANKHLH